MGGGAWIHKIIAGSDKVNLNGNRITILSLGISKLGAFQTGSDTFHPSDTIAQTLDVNLITGIADREDSISVYPNPVNDYLVIQGLSPINSNAIKIINTKGQSVYGNDFKGSVEIISLKDFTPGIYILFINMNRYKIVKRWSKSWFQDYNLNVMEIKFNKQIDTHHGTATWTNPRATKGVLE